MFAPHKQRSKGIILTVIAFLSGIAMFLTGCSSDDNNPTGNSGGAAAGAAVSHQDKVSSNLPDTGSCPANLSELWVSYGLQEVDDPRTITETDIDQIYVDYAVGSRCDLLGAPEPKAVAEAAKAAICGTTLSIQSAAVAQLEAMSKFLYGHGFGAVGCARTGATVAVNAEMLAGTGPYAPY